MLQQSRPRKVLIAVIAVIAALIALPGAAFARAYLPPTGKVWSGFTGGVTSADVNAFANGQGAAPPVVQFFAGWSSTTSRSYYDGLIAVARKAHSRPAFALTTSGTGGELITPGALSQGKGDAALIGWNQVLADAGGPVYVRLFYQMDSYLTKYCAFNADGTPRDAAHSTRSFIAAWRRTVLIMRGGPVATINASLHALGLPGLKTNLTTLPQPQVAFLWVPSYTPAPAHLAANSWDAYWPGGAYVDWVGTQYASNFAVLPRLTGFFNAVQAHHKPFVIDQWGVLNTGDDPSFAAGLLGWVKAHKQVRMLIYNQGLAGSGFRLQNLPGIRSQLRAAIRRKPFS